MSSPSLAARAVAAAAAIVTLVLAGCDVTADLGHNDTPFGDGGVVETSPEPMPLPHGPVPTPPDAPIAELKARCADPAHGPVARYEDFSGFQRQVVGRWFSCSPRQPLVADDLGIEFHADGTWNLLRDDGTGKLVAQRGLDHEGRWGEKYSDFIDYFQVDSEGQPLGLFSFAFENNPRRMRMRSELTTVEGADGDGWYVAAAADGPVVLP